MCVHPRTEISEMNAAHNKFQPKRNIRHEAIVDKLELSLYRVEQIHQFAIINYNHQTHTYNLDLAFLYPWFF